MSERAGLEPATQAHSQSGPVVLRLLVGARLRQLREASGISAWDAGYAIRGSQSKISRMESGRTGFKERDVADLLTLYGLVDDEEREQLLATSRQANAPGWWHQYSDVLPQWSDVYIGLEEAASAIRAYELQLIPGLLQTEEYARSVARLASARADESEIERRVSFLLRRQHHVVRPDGPHLWFLLDEAALRRPLGGRQVLRNQLEYLADICNLPNIAIQIVSFEPNSYAGVNTPFTILRFGSPEIPDMVYLEQATSALYLDKPDDVATYLRLMDALSLVAQPPSATRYLLRDILAN